MAAAALILVHAAVVGLAVAGATACPAQVVIAAEAAWEAEGSAAEVVVAVAAGGGGDNRL